MLRTPPALQRSPSRLAPRTVPPRASGPPWSRQDSVSSVPAQREFDLLTRDHGGWSAPRGDRRHVEELPDPVAERLALTPRRPPPSEHVAGRCADVEVCLQPREHLNTSCTQRG